MIGILPIIISCTIILLIFSQSKTCHAELSDGDREFLSNLFATKIEESEARVVNTTSQGFQSLHNFGRARVLAIASSSSKLYLPNWCNGSVTRHAVFYRGKITELFSPHLECNSTIDNIRGRNIFLHNRLDLGAIGGCPAYVHSALNISTVVAPELGDEVISYGFGDVAEVYRGSVASVRNHDRDCVSASDHWTGKCNV